MNTNEIAASLTGLMTELLDGPPGKACFVLNPGDAGLLRSLDKLSADAASKSIHAGATIAAHADHLRFGFSLMNRWMNGENPWNDADFSASWRISKVTDAEWQKMRADLAREARQWRDAMATPRDADDTELNGIIGSVVHLAYHLGAIRQIDSSTRGPKAP